MAQGAKNRKIAEKYEREVAGTVEPTSIDPNNYKLDLLHALNYYNVAVENKEKRKWTLNYLKRENKDLIPKIDELHEYHFHTLGALIRIKENGMYVSPDDLIWIENRFKELVVKQQEQKERELKERKDDEAKPINVQDKIRDKAHEFMSDIDNIIDEYITNDGQLPKLGDFLKSNNVSKPVANHIPKFYDRMIKELNEVLNDECEQLKEAYSHMKKTKIKKLVEWLESFKTEVDMHGVAIKVRKPRAVKPKSPLVVAKNVKYLIEDTESGLKSEHPSTIIGSSNVWIYDTKYRKLTWYTGENLSIKGTTVLNFDVNKSKSKTIRKPEVLKDLIEMSSKKLEMAFRTIKSVERVPNGRINQNCIIMKVFK